MNTRRLSNISALKPLPSIVACVAALGLFVLTIAAIVRPVADMRVAYIGMMALAWVGVLASALMARDGGVALDRRSIVAQTGAPEHTPGIGSTAVIDFARELHATLESDPLRLLIARRLPALLGVRDVWVIARSGNGQQIIAPSLAGSDAIAMFGDHARQWATYPMKADGQTIGVLGAALPVGGFSEKEHRLCKLVTELVGQSLATATAFEAMREASLVDALTGCSTRAEGTRRLEAELRRAQRGGTSVAVLMMDLDHFKSINDRFGHKTGDAALTAVADTLLTSLRASDVRCRWGGEEFLLVLPDSSVERAQRAAENLRRRIADTPVAAGDEIVHVTASFGLTLTERGETDPQQLMARADTALYEAKRMGRNRTSLVLAPGAAKHAARPWPTPVDRVAVQNEPGELADHRNDGWDGVERRDPRRRDRRRAPSPGRRSTDHALAATWRDG
jgi:diguanylate cyclase (GGDEF)-like protein